MAFVETEGVRRQDDDDTVRFLDSCFCIQNNVINEQRNPANRSPKGDNYGERFDEVYPLCSVLALCGYHSVIGIKFIIFGDI